MNFSEGVPKFLLVIDESLEFKTFHIGIRVSISCVVKNNIRFLNSWYAIGEIVTCLNLYERSHKVEVIHHQLKSMSTSARSKKLYSPEAIVRTFSYFATSRSLYEQMREDYQFPSISILTKITSSCANQTSGAFLKNVFHSLETKQKNCILLHDEIYIKKCCSITEAKSSENLKMTPIFLQKQCLVLW